MTQHWQRPPFPRAPPSARQVNDSALQAWGAKRRGVGAICLGSISFCWPGAWRCAAGAMLSARVATAITDRDAVADRVYRLHYNQVLQRPQRLMI